jgi:hypothetical protein
MSFLKLVSLILSTNFLPSMLDKSWDGEKVILELKTGYIG